MYIIIQILIALRLISVPDQFTQDYQNTHSSEIAQATMIADKHLYREEEGGVIIDDDVNPIR